MPVKWIDKLTAPQVKLLDDLFAKSDIPYQTMTFKARKGKLIEHLDDLGLVTYDLVQVPDALRGRHRLNYVVTLTKEGVNVVHALAKERFAARKLRLY